MFITLQRTTTGTSSSNSGIATALLGILTHTITSPDQLNAAHFDQVASSWEVGSYDDYSPWTVVSSVAGDTGNAVLSKPCVTAGVSKTNWMRLSWDPSSVGFSTGTDAATTVTGTVGLVIYNYYNTDHLLTANVTIFVRVCDTFFHVWAGLQTAFVQNLGSYRYVGGVMVFEWCDAPYDATSLEASCKLFVHQAVESTGCAVPYFVGGNNNPYFGLTVAPCYNPFTDSYKAARVFDTPSNIAQSRISTIGVSRGADLIENLNLLVPLHFSDLATGWLGGNMSEATGFWLCTSDRNVSELTVKIGAATYQLIALAEVHPALTVNILVQR